MSQLPSGTVTFLFTDIEGSTRLWEQHPDSMRLALACHEGLLRQSIETHDGYVFKTVGDAFCAAFSSAPDALHAALSAQQAMRAEAWDLPTPLLVRMALHTGAAEERDGDYFGPPLNRVARLMAAGHGAQTLLSEATQELTRDQLPASAALRDLGPRRLKDLGRPERVFQLLHPELPADFPPLRSLDNPDLPNNLPQQATSFIGRETQVEEVKGFLDRIRLLTLVGAGGAGKTRLALQAAADLLDQHFDGVWLVELAALSDPALVPSGIAQALGVTEEPGRPISRTLMEWLRARRLLLVLDNCEHLVSACAFLAADLLRACPDVHILATSREPLGVAGEQIYRVPSLAMPDSAGAQTAEGLSQCEAVRLFVERAQAVKPDFAVTDANAPAVAQVCRRLDGIPLALELAAARIRSLSVGDVSARLDQRFRLLTGGPRDALPRQQTLRALIDWSYDLLTGSEKALLRRLSVFMGGWTLEAAEAVCPGEDVEEWEVLDLLTGLVDKSLISAEETGDRMRYRMQETLREYAAESLAAEDAAQTAVRHAAFFQALGEQARAGTAGPEQADWMDRLERDHDNLRAALRWGLTHESALSLRLAECLWRFWQVRSFYAEGRRWLESTLAQPATGPPPPARRRASALNALGLLAVRQNDYPAAHAAHEEALALYRGLGEDDSIASQLNNLGVLANRLEDWAAARPLFEESLALKRRGSDESLLASTLNNLGQTLAGLGDDAGAEAFYAEALGLARRYGQAWGEALLLSNLADVALHRGDRAGALARQRESLALRRPLRDREGVADSLTHIGHILRLQGRPEPAARLAAASAALIAEITVGQTSSAAAFAVSERAALEAALGPDDFRRCWAEGSQWPLDAAVAQALADSASP